MILNEQLIEDMFMDNDTSKENIEAPPEVSLNFTVSSGSSKHPAHKQRLQPEQQKHHEVNILNLAVLELQSFGEWMRESEQALEKSNLGIANLLLQVESLNKEEHSNIQDDLIMIKYEVTRRENVKQKEKQECSKCVERIIRIQQLQTIMNEQQNDMIRVEHELNSAYREQAQTVVGQVMASIIGNVELSILQEKISNLNQEISALKNEKFSLERTFMFNKTKNSDITSKMELQRSKGLSAAKNSTNSSEILNRHQQTLFFIDPIESDVQQWLKFFEFQKNRYMNLCKKEQNQKSKELGRSFTKQERTHLHSEGKIFIIFSSIKEIWKNLLRIKENTSRFFPGESTNKSLTKQKFNSSQQENGIMRLLKSENEKLYMEYFRSMKLNECLTKQKENWIQITNELRQQRKKENTMRRAIQDKYKHAVLQIQKMIVGIKKLEEENQKIKIKMKGSSSDKGIDMESVSKNNVQKQFKHKFEQMTEQIKSKEIHLRCYELKLKKQSLQRKKIHNEIEQIKGSFRIYCKINNKPMSQQSQKTYIKAIQNRLMFNDGEKCIKFDKIINNQPQSQTKLNEQIKRVVQSAIDGYNVCFVNYGQTDSGKSRLMFKNKEQMGIFPSFYKQIFKLIENQKEFLQVQVQISLVEISNNKISDLFDVDNKKNIQIRQDQQGNICLSQANFIAIDSSITMDDLFTSAMVRKLKIANDYNDSKYSHHVITIIMDIDNKKTQEKYRSRINFVNVAGSELLIQNNCQNQTLLNNTKNSLLSLLSAMNSVSKKQTSNHFRQNKLTHILKNTLNLQSKIILIANISPNESDKEKTVQVIQSVIKLKEKNTECERNPSRSEKDMMRQNKQNSEVYEYRRPTSKQNFY